MEALVRDYFSDESHGQDWSRTLGPLLEALNNTTDDADTAAIDRLILALEEAAVTGVEWETRTVALLRALLLTQSPHKDNHDHRPSLLLARLQSRPSSGNDAQMAKVHGHSVLAPNKCTHMCMCVCVFDTLGVEQRGCSTAWGWGR